MHKGVYQSRNELSNAEILEQVQLVWEAECATKGTLLNYFLKISIIMTLKGEGVRAMTLILARTSTTLFNNRP